MLVVKGEDEDIISDCFYGLTERTRKQYRCYLGLLFSQIYPDLKGNLETQASRFLAKSREPGGAEWAQEQFISLLKNLPKQFKPSVYKSYNKAFKCFCDNYDINLQWKRIRKRHIPKGGEIAKDRIPTVEEIKQILEYPDRRVKPLVLVTLSSGIRIGAWQYLQLKHVIPMDKYFQELDREKERLEEVAAAKLIVYAGEPEQYLTFITPEAFYAVKEWMDSRKRAGEKISEESWLMRDMFPWDQGYGSSNPHKISTDGVARILRRALTEQGVRGKPITAPGETKRYPFKVTHGFRKFFETKAYQAGMNRTNVYFLTDHDLGIDSHYVRPTDNELLKSYLEIVDVLTVTNASTTIKELESLKKRQDEVYQKDKEKDQEILELRGQMGRMGSKMEQLIDNVNFYSNQFEAYKEEFGPRHLTKKERQRVELFLELLKSHPDIDREED